MKTKSTFIILTLCLILLGLNSPSTTNTPEELGKEIFNALKNNNLEAIKLLIVTVEDIGVTIDSSDLPDNQKAAFKSSYEAKINTDIKKTMSEIEKGFNTIRSNMNSKKCQKDVKLLEVISNTNKLRNLPFELGEIEIKYSCFEESETINVEVMRTKQGWRILEKLSLDQKTNN